VADDVILIRRFSIRFTSSRDRARDDAELNFPRWCSGYRATSECERLQSHDLGR